MQEVIGREGDKPGTDLYERFATLTCHNTVSITKCGCLSSRRGGVRFQDKLQNPFLCSRCESVNLLSYVTGHPRHRTASFSFGVAGSGGAREVRDGVFDSR